MFWSNLSMQFLKINCLLFMFDRSHITCKLMFIALDTKKAEEAWNVL